MKGQFSIRAATPADVPLILQFIRELAACEKLAHEVTATEKLLRRHLFGRRPTAEVILARLGRRRPGLPFFSIISPPSWASRGFIWKICMCVCGFGDGAAARR